MKERFLVSATKNNLLFTSIPGTIVFSQRNFLFLEGFKSAHKFRDTNTFVNFHGNLKLKKVFFGP